MRRLILKWLANVAAFYLATLLFPSVWAAGPATLFIAGAVLGLVNLLIRPILMFFTIPINFLTLGLFSWVINTLMVLLTAYLVPSMHIPGFWVALVIALIVAVLNMLFVGKKERRR